MPEVLVKPEEQQLIQEKFEELLKLVKLKEDQDEPNIRMAFEIAVNAHAPQRRKSGEPYILHPIEVARICADEIGLGPTAVIAALLHDTVEDTEVTLDRIETLFGTKIAKIVDGLTKLDGLYNVPSVQAENFKKVLRTLVEDVRVVLIKMADRLHNMRTLGSMPRNKQLKIAAETSYIYAPLAHRLGLYSFKTEFQDLCMKITDRETYSEIAKKLAATKRDRNRYIEEFIGPVKEQLNDLGFAYEIYGRPKSIFSIWNKIKKKKVQFEEIYDLFAVRIVLDVEDPRMEKNYCWQVYSTVTDIYRPIPERLKDWVTTPKSNGYESLHTTVIGPDGRFVEVQIRSRRMDEIAEKGFAAHWKYKGNTPQPDVYEHWLDNVRELMDQNEGGDAVEFLSDFKTNLFQEEVYVFTPNGDMKVLPKGATALDFAFSVHSDVGYHATAIKVNNKLVPMGTKLHNGDQIVVTTSSKQMPNESWMKMVVTGKARSKIRSALKEKRRKQGEFGKESLERKCKNLRVDFDEPVDLLVKYLGLKSRVDLYYGIAMGTINLQVLKNFKVEGNKLVEIQEEEIIQPVPKPVEINRPRKASQDGRPRLLINGQEASDLDYSLATCCNPVKGDDIFAYVTSTKGMRIHRTTCPNAEHMMANYGYRIHKAEWVSSANTSFVAELLITGVDSGPGVIERLTHNISSELGLNIRSLSISGDEGYFEGRLKVLVLNKDQLHLTMQHIQKLEGVSSVIRVD